MSHVPAATTLAALIAGRARIGGADLDLTRPETIQPCRGRQMAMVFQDPLLSLNPVFTIGAHLAEALKRREPGLSRVVRRERMVAALTKVGMSDPARRIGQYRRRCRAVCASGW